MPYRVFEVRQKDRSRLDAALADDVLSRQSVTVKDAKRLGYPDRDTVFVVVEGSDGGMLRAEALLLEFGRRAGAGADIYARIKSEDEDAASGLGFVMGD